MEKKVRLSRSSGPSDNLSARSPSSAPLPPPRGERGRRGGPARHGRNFFMAGPVNSLRILLLEDNPLDAERLQEVLCAGGIDGAIHRVSSHAEFLAFLQE